MTRLRTIIALWVALFVAGPAYAFNIPPFATDHEVFMAGGGPPGMTPGPSCGSAEGCKKGSPIEVATGNYIQTLPVLTMAGRGPSVNLTLTYHSIDHRIGPFGAGWTFSYDERLTKTTDGTLVSAILSSGAGRRDVFVAAGSAYVSPPYLYSGLVEQADETRTLREKDGSYRSFDARGHLTAIVDRNGNALSFAYDAAGFLTTITDASGRTITLTKGADGRVSTVTDPGGRRFQFQYDGAGNLTTLIDPLGNSTTMQYDAAHHLTQLADPRGDVLSRAGYNADGMVTSYTERGESWTVSYSPATKTTTETDSSGNRWTHVYEANGLITQTTDPLGNRLRRVFDSNLNVVQTIDQNNHATAMTFDAAGNRLTVTDALGRVTAATYDSTFNLPLTITDPLGQVTTFSYDARGNLMRKADPLGQLTQYQYDGYGQLIGVTDADGQSTSFAYDGSGRLVSTTDPLGRTTTTIYDVIGNITSRTDASGRGTSFTYDAARHLLTTTDPLGGSTEYRYDPSGNVTAIVTANRGTTTYEYDTLNRVVSTTNPIGRAASFAYDRKDNLTRRTDPNGFSTTYTYDSLSRLTRRNGSEVITYAYDAIGQLLTMTNPATTLTFAYDVANQLTQVRTTDGAAPATTISYTYDANGRRVTTANPSGGVTHYGYDAVSRLTSLTDQSSDTFAFAYDRVSRRTSMSGPLGRTVTYGWDLAGRLTGLNDLAAGAVVPLTYAYDPVGNVTSKGTAAGVDSYAYDPLDRLLGAVHPAGQPSEAYAYDDLGNRTSSHLSPTYTHDVANRLLADATYDYTYDNNGNLTRRTHRATGGVTTYTYDSENRLVTLATSGVAASYQYDGLGRRVAKTVNGVRTAYAYDGQNIVAEYAAAALAATYTHGPNVDELLSVKRGATTSYFQKDAQGSILQTVSASGVTSSYTYDSYGRIVGETGAPQSPFRYTGREYDSESGLYFYRARYYNPDMGRFISEDPIGFVGGANLYNYVKSNPIAASDPYGLFGWEDLPDIPQPVVDFSAGFGDTLSFGLTDLIRDQMGTNQFVNKCSASYTAGEVAGVGLDIAIGGAAGLEAAGERAAGKEFSHWIPNRLGGSRSVWNGNYVSTAEHALSDPYRYRFMPRAWKEANPLPNSLIQQWNRIPKVLKGGAAGAAAGAAGAASGGSCGCE